MTPQKGYVQGRYEVASFNVPIHLITLLDEFVNKRPGSKKSELVSKAICKEIGVCFEEVNMKNGELYPKRSEIPAQ